MYNNVHRCHTIAGVVLVLEKRDCVFTSRPALLKAAILAEMSHICIETRETYCDTMNEADKLGQKAECFGFNINK